jgi:hypothetical protein
MSPWFWGPNSGPSPRTGSPTTHTEEKKPLSPRRFRRSKRPEALGLGFLHAPPGTRTPNLLIKSQLLCQLS